MTKYLSTLFDPTDSVCFGHTIYDTKVRAVDDSDAQFVTLNPVTISRKDANVTTHRNILIEMDTDTIENQKLHIERLQVPFSTMVFSGKKSLHTIISLVDPCPSREHYNALVRITYKILDPLGNKIIDPSAKNPGRFTRNAGAIRDGIEQTLIATNPRISQRQFFEWVYKHLSVSELAKQMNKWAPKRVSTNGEFQKIWGHNTAEFIAGRTTKACRHDAARDAAVELFKCGKTESEVLDLLDFGFYLIKPDQGANELENIVKWISKNISQEE